MKPLSLQIMKIGHLWGRISKNKKVCDKAPLAVCPYIGPVLVAQLVEHYLVEEQRDHLYQSPMRMFNLLRIRNGFQV